MKKIHPLLFLVLGSILLAASCKKEPDPVLPPLTFTGANTFGCYIDGRLFIPEKEYNWLESCGGPSSDYELVDIYETGDYYSITINGSQCADDEGIQIVLNKTKIDTGLYPLRYNRWDHFLREEEHGAYYRNGSRYHNTGMSYMGYCRIHYFNESKNIVSGTFEFSAFNEDDSTRVEVTEGRFDIGFNN